MEPKVTGSVLPDRRVTSLVTSTLNKEIRNLCAAVVVPSNRHKSNQKPSDPLDAARMVLRIWDLHYRSFELHCWPP
ncbi:hypothetical protein TNCV_3845091 [Trichonephila clavipes]|nr:hypothetical protein TNCV_3845091 [Trichonephila clavipes]